MDSRLYQAAAQLPPGDSRIEQLYTLAVAPGEPRSLAQRLHMGLLLVAALLLASGLVFWVAANWQEQTRMFKLLLIEGALLVSVLASLFWRRGRIAALLCATLALGGLLAFVGQTYQTGADAWQLFATWAALALVWTLLARSDVLWMLWVLVVGLLAYALFRFASPAFDIEHKGSDAKGWAQRIGHAGSAIGALRRMEQLIQEAVVTVPRALIAETIDLVAVLSGRGSARRLAELARVEGLGPDGDYRITPATTPNGEAE